VELVESTKEKRAMKTVRIFLFGALAMAGAMFAPVAKAQQGGVAIVDVDAVAREIGADKQVLEALKQAQDNLNSRLKDTQAAMQKQFDEAVVKAGGDKATDEQKQQLAQFNQRLQDQFSQYKGQAQVTLNREQAKLVLAFREKVRPVALEIAKGKGLDVVLQKSDQVIGFAESVDISKEVVAKLKTQQAAEPKAEAKEEPKAAPKATPAETEKKNQ